MKVAVVGATGLVGAVILKVLEERQFPVSVLLPVASERSVGRTVRFAGSEVPVVSAETALAARPQIALFSAGAAVSRKLAPRFAAIGCRVVDNSSCWRMDPSVPLVVPEINGDVLGASDMIVANPNCSTIVGLWNGLQGPGADGGGAGRPSVGRVSGGLSPSDRPEHPAAYRRFSGQRLHQGGDEDGQ